VLTTASAGAWVVGEFSLRLIYPGNGRCITTTWADVLGRVEKMVRLEAVTSKEKTGSTSKFDGNSLERLAKNGTDQSQMKITYLPSRNKNDDGRKVRPVSANAHVAPQLAES
jgi:hypothetical protein